MPITKEVVKKDSEGNIVKTYNSCKEAAIELGVTKDELSKKIKRKKYINGFIYEYTGVKSGNTIIDNTDKIRCPYCGLYFKTYNGVSKHIFKYGAHEGVTREQLLTDVKYNGIRPTCKCGCGGYTTILHKNGAHFADYIQGHWNSVVNNWGHNPKAQEKSAETRRRQYLSGERQQWNKGKKWDEVYTQEEQERLRDNLVNKITERINTSKFTISSKMEDDFVTKFIKPYTDNYKRQFYLPEIKQFCDIYLPEKNIIIEINGGYWHCDRNIYYNGPINPIQQDKIKRDEIKYRYLRENGFLLLVIWEDDIKKNSNLIKCLMEKIFSINTWKDEVISFLSSNRKLQNLKVDLIDLTFDNELSDLKIDKLKGVKIYEDEWLFKKDIVKSRLLNAASMISEKIYARKCIIKQITYKESAIFLEENHLQGKISGSCYYGLYYNDMLVSIMVFGKLRKNMGNECKDGEYELLRFCSKINTNVIGGAGKLFKKFIKEQNPAKIISYCDKRWGDGEFYEKIGMKYSHDTQCNYFYVNEIERKRENRFKYRKDVLVKMGFDEDKSEKQIMIERGIYRIYDYGCKVFVWNKDIYN